jgi:hypothetical protein
MVIVLRSKTSVIRTLHVIGRDQNSPFIQFKEKMEF